ncbi:unnamed protein product [Symbiodinium sp. CCMP2592]|nr:unnamed protein product [Symbiodinium sp. CCMP2592]
MDTKDADKRASPEASGTPAQEPPQKWQKASGKGDGLQASDARRNGSPLLVEATATSGGVEVETKRERELRELVRELVRLVLRQADTLSYLQMDLGFMVFLKTTMQPHLPEEDATQAKQWAVVTDLYQAAEKWHAMKQADPNSINATLRTTLVHCLVQALLERVSALESNTEDLARLEKLGLMEGDKFLYLKWNGELRRHEKSTQEPLTLAQAKTYLLLIKNHLIFPRVILRFHALRKLTPNMASDVVPFTLEIHNRCRESQEVYLAFERMSYKAVWHLVGGTVRPSKLGRGPLEKAVEEAAKRL